MIPKGLEGRGEENAAWPQVQLREAISKLSTGRLDLGIGGIALISIGEHHPTSS
jgi:hypothetical protein